MKKLNNAMIIGILALVAMLIIWASGILDIITLNQQVIGTITIIICQVIANAIIYIRIN